MKLENSPVGRSEFCRLTKTSVSWKGLVLSVALFLSAAMGFAQKAEKFTFDFDDRTVTFLVPASVKVEKTETGGFKVTYKVDSYINPDSYEDRIFMEVTATYFKSPKSTTAVLDMDPFDVPATFHVWNTAGKTGYTTFDQGNPMVDTANITMMDSAEAFSGDIKAMGFSTTLSTDMGEHVVEIRKFTFE